MPRIHFQQQLAQLKDKLLAMAALSQQALEFSVEAYLRDQGLCHHVLRMRSDQHGPKRTVTRWPTNCLPKSSPWRST